MSITQRVGAIIVYRRWFYAPGISGRSAAQRLAALGFVWRGGRWRTPTVTRFLQAMMPVSDRTLGATLCVFADELRARVEREKQ